MFNFCSGTMEFVDIPALEVHTGVSDPSLADPKFSLFLRIIDDKTFSLTKVRSILSVVWELKGPFMVRGDCNTFSVNFLLMEDLLFILNYGPWSVGNALIATTG